MYGKEWKILLGIGSYYDIKCRVYGPGVVNECMNASYYVCLIKYIAINKY